MLSPVEAFLGFFSRIIILLLTAIIVPISAASCRIDARESAALTQRSKIDLTPCVLASYATKVLCGKLEVFEDRAARSGRKIWLFCPPWSPKRRLIRCSFWPGSGSNARTLQFPSCAGMGTYLTVSCSESLPFISEDEISRETGGTFTGKYRIRTHQEACREWPQADIPADYFAAVKFTCACPDAIRSAGQRDTRSPGHRIRPVVIEQSPNSSAPTAHKYLRLCRKHHRSVHHNRYNGRFGYRLRGKFATPGISNRIAGTLSSLRQIRQSEAVGFCSSKVYYLMSG